MNITKSRVIYVALALINFLAAGIIVDYRAKLASAEATVACLRMEVESQGQEILTHQLIAAFGQARLVPDVDTLSNRVTGYRLTVPAGNDHALKQVETVHFENDDLLGNDEVKLARDETGTWSAPILDSRVVSTPHILIVRQRTGKILPQVYVDETRHETIDRYFLLTAPAFSAKSQPSLGDLRYCYTPDVK